MKFFEQTLRPARRAVAATLGAGLVAAITAVVGGTAPPATATGQDCQLVRLTEPRGFYDGSVMDIEQVAGDTVYLGFSHESRRGTEHQRLLVWRGTDAAPVRVGPGGFMHDIGFDLTPNGLVLGRSENGDTGEVRPWVQDLATMELTFLDVDSGPRGGTHGVPFLRGINSSGELAGTLDRTPDPWDRGSDAVGYASPASAMTLLEGSAASVESGAFGINEAGARTGFIGRTWLGGTGDWLVYEPVVWAPDGSVVPLATPHGIEGSPRSIKDDGSVSGSIFWGEDPATGHVEAAYWPRPDVNIGLGVLPGGGWSDVFGMDEGGWLVGAMDRLVDPKKERLGPEGYIDHSFLWTPGSTPDTVRILPSLYGVAEGIGDWRKWRGSGAHGVNRELDQVATGTHVGFRKGKPVAAPTVFLNASTCGVEVATTHDPFGVEGMAADDDRAAARKSDLHRPHGH